MLDFSCTVVCGLSLDLPWISCLWRRQPYLGRYGQDQNPSASVFSNLCVSTPHLLDVQASRLVVPKNTVCGGGAGQPNVSQDSRLGTCAEQSLVMLQAGTAVRCSALATVGVYGRIAINVKIRVALGLYCTQTVVFEAFHLAISQTQVLLSWHAGVLWRTVLHSAC